MAVVAGVVLTGVEVATRAMVVGILVFVLFETNKDVMDLVAPPKKLTTDGVICKIKSIPPKIKAINTIEMTILVTSKFVVLGGR